MANSPTRLEPGAINGERRRSPTRPATPAAFSRAAETSRLSDKKSQYHSEYSDEPMEFDELEQSVKRLRAVVDGFPICAASLDDFKPTEEKIQAMRESLMHLNARSLLLTAKYKQYIADKRGEKSQNEAGEKLQNDVSEALINAKAIKLCLHSSTIISILSDKEGNEEDKKKLYTYMSKLFTLNDNVMAIQETIEKTSQVQHNLKIECKKALLDHKKFLNEQEKLRKERLQKTHPEIVANKDKMEKKIQRMNVMKKLIRNFIAVSGHLLEKEPILIQMLENHRELVNIETIAKMSQSSEEKDKE